ncbi:hypothetical protein LCGC14_2185620 [marine sediment metagenome]|uniref:Uncharacterized protein n=1 Tax=marine sediment metagenome TaxID=412755 RepID=A0A0F9E841_9ZZZZ
MHYRFRQAACGIYNARICASSSLRPHSSVSHRPHANDTIIHARAVPIVHMTRKSCGVKGLGHINHVSTRTIRLLTSKELSIGLIDLCCKSCDTKWLGDGQFLCS